MQFVKLVVPQHLYDELKLHTNRTIMMSHSDHFSNADTRDINVGTAINCDKTSSQQRETLQTETQVNEDWATNESSHENPDASILTLVVNVGNGKQKILTYHLKSIRVVSNIPSELGTGESTFTNCDDVSTSVRGLNSAISEPHTKVTINVVYNKPEETSTEPDAYCNNDDLSIQSEESQRDQFLSDPETDEVRDERESKESCLENPCESFTAILEAENGNQKIVTHNMKSNSLVQNAQERTSNHSDDVGTSTKEFHSVICEPDTYDSDSVICLEPEETFRENDTHCNNDSIFIKSTETSSQQHEFLLSEPDANQKSNDRESDESRHENSDASCTADVKGKKKIQTCNIKSISSMTNVLNRPIIIAFNSPGDAASNRKKPSKICDSAVIQMSKTNKIPEAIPQSLNVLRVTRETNESRKIQKRKMGAKYEISYPRLCMYCKKRYSCKASFSNHKKLCGRVLLKVKYPRCCTICNRQYASQTSFYNHKKKCGRESEKEKIKYPRRCLSCNRIYSTQPSFSKHKKICGLKRGEGRQSKAKLVYPRCCSKCNRFYSSKVTFYKHKRKCDVFQKGEKKVKISYPRICLECNQTYSCKQTFSKHKNVCLKISGAIRNRKKPGELIPVKSDSERVLRYFVVKKDSSA